MAKALPTYESAPTELGAAKNKLAYLQQRSLDAGPENARPILAEIADVRHQIWLLNRNDPDAAQKKEDTSRMAA